MLGLISNLRCHGDGDRDPWRTSKIKHAVQVDQGTREMRRGNDRIMTGVNRKSTWPNVSDAGYRGSTEGELELGPLVRMSALCGLTVVAWELRIFGKDDLEQRRQQSPSPPFLSRVPHSRQVYIRCLAQGMAQARAGSVAGAGASPHSVSLKVLR